MKKYAKKIAISFAAIVFFAVFLLVWAFYIEPNLLIVRNITVNDSQLSGIRVAYISDIHACQNDGAFLKKLVAKVNSQNPDVILLGGDYVVVDIYKNKTMEPKKIIQHLSDLKAKHGIFMVLGNHENSRRIAKEIIDATKGTGIIVLQNKNTKLKINDKNVCILGIADFCSAQHRIEQALAGAEKPIIAFTHSPDLFPQIPDFVNLVFAGHTHGGQVSLPIYGPVARPRHLIGPYVKGFYEENSKKMFVSSGVGTSHLKVRFFNIPEIVVADFK